MSIIPQELRRRATTIIGALAVSALCVFGAVGPAYAADSTASVQANGSAG